jgi:hypothetical protein
MRLVLINVLGMLNFQFFKIIMDIMDAFSINAYLVKCHEIVTYI